MDAKEKRLAEPACPSCGVPYGKHLGLIPICTELARVRAELRRRLEDKMESDLCAAQLLAGFAWDDEVAKTLRDRTMARIKEIVGD